MIKKPTPSIQGIGKAVKAIDERLKKLENLMRSSGEENNEENNRMVSLQNDCEEAK